MYQSLFSFVMIWTFIAILLVGVTAAFVLFYLKRQICLRTKELQLEIQERRQAEEKLAERSQFIESIINLSPDILYIYDIEDQQNIYANDGVQMVLGYSAQEIKEMISIIMHPDDFQTYLTETIPKYLKAKDKEPIIHQYRMKSRDGQWRWLVSNEGSSILLTDKFFFL